VEIEGEIGPGKEGGSGLSRLAVTLVGPGEDNRAGTQSGVALGQGEQGPARTDFDVIGVRADGQDGQGPVGRHIEEK
jgi:hypothetical protein